MKQLILCIALCLLFISSKAQNKQPVFTKAGFYSIKNSGREIYNFNVGWRFIKANIKNAEKINFNDKSWEIVNLPHGLEFLPAQASGSINYQGPAWYRKHFNLPDSLKGKKLTLHFEAIMGKSKIYINGQLIKENFGGFLPFQVEIEKHIKWGEENVIAILADNSDDPTYPPGKAQNIMDFAYFGGIYRDVYLLSTNKIFISNPNNVDKTAGGGVFVHYEKVSKYNAEIIIKTDIINKNRYSKNINLETQLVDKKGKIITTTITKNRVRSNSSRTITQKIKIKNPHLWSPDKPYLYDLKLMIKDNHGKSTDGLKKRIGIRKIEFKGKEGFYLNGEAYHDKLIGANRHQDYGYVGNALPNSGQWRDVKKLRDAGMRIIRCAHYPQDPAFMDACDELGMFIIVATPGWQFWNDQPIFQKRVYNDIRNMVRRDRNHPSVIMWEPILNETKYPDYFAKQVHEIVHEEYPWQGAYTVCDGHAKGHEHFDVNYKHPVKGECWSNTVEATVKNYKKSLGDYSKEKKSVFTREWGDNVDDWSSHNSTSRVSRGWGETPQLIQALQYAGTSMVYTSFEGLYLSPRQHVGGTLWHSFDHQRGYHPDTFFGGIMDVFRQPKYSYYLFMSQRDPNIKLEKAESGPMIYTAHELSPFSPKDITVFTNCDEVRMILLEKDTLIQKVDKKNHFMPHPPIVFKDAYDFMDMKKLQRKHKLSQANIVVEGLIGGKVVVREVKRPAKRVSKLMIELDNEKVALEADGSDFVTLIVSLVDEDGYVKRLNNYSVRIEIEGEGKLLGGRENGANPVKLEWGTAPILVQSTTKTGAIKVKAHLQWEGINTPISGEFTFNSIKSPMKSIYSETPTKEKRTTINQQNSKEDIQSLKRKLLEMQQKLNQIRLEKVSKQQEQFENKE